MEGLYAWVGRHAQLLRKVYDKNNRITPFVLFENWFQIYYWILWLAGVWWGGGVGGRVTVGMGKKRLSGKVVGGG